MQIYLHLGYSSLAPYYKAKIDVHMYKILCYTCINSKTGTELSNIEDANIFIFRI